MRVTYVASDNSAGDAQVLGTAGRDIFVKKVLFGAPSDGLITQFYNKAVATGHTSGMGSVSSANLAFKFTQATHAEGCDWVREVDFTGYGSGGMQLDGGSFHTNANQVTVIWEYCDESKF